LEILHAEGSRGIRWRVVAYLFRERVRRPLVPRAPAELSVSLDLKDQIGA